MPRLCVRFRRSFSARSLASSAAASVSSAMPGGIAEGSNGATGSDLRAGPAARRLPEELLRVLAHLGYARGAAEHARQLRHALRRRQRARTRDGAAVLLPLHHRDVVVGTGG